MYLFVTQEVSTCLNPGRALLRRHILCVAFTFLVFRLSAPTLVIFEVLRTLNPFLENLRRCSV